MVRSRSQCVGANTVFIIVVSREGMVFDMERNEREGSISPRP